jgi:hypothetical protein
MIESVKEVCVGHLIVDLVADLGQLNYCERLNS